MNEYDMENLNLVEEEEIKRFNKVVDKLEQRIATLEVDKLKLKQRIFKLEKVSGSHAKCIGEIREEKQCPTKKQ